MLSSRVDEIAGVCLSSLGHASGAAGIFLSWDKNEDNVITKDEVMFRSCYY